MSLRIGVILILGAGLLVGGAVAYSAANKPCWDLAAQGRLVGCPPQLPDFAIAVLLVASVFIILGVAASIRRARRT